MFASFKIDEVSKKYFNKDYDKNGLLAKNGKINNKALVSMLSDKYFYQDPPKSTGFEKFNIQWIKKYKDKFQYFKFFFGKPSCSGKSPPFPGYINSLIKDNKKSSNLIIHP